MSQSFKNDLILGNAYRMFVGEIAKHLAFSRELFWGSKTPGPDQLIEASARFHTIRGGAGFFSLTDIASTAAKLENKLKSDNFNLAAEIDHIRDLIQEIEGFAGQMPAPTPPSE